MSTLPAATPRHRVNAAVSAYYGPNLADTPPLGLRYKYGTWTCPLIGFSWGIIKSCEVKSIGEASSLKDEGGSTFLHHLADPGWSITGTLLHDASGNPGVGNAPQRMSLIRFSETFEENRGAPVNGGVVSPGGLDPATGLILPAGLIPPLVAVMMELTFKYEQAGWQEFSFTAEARDSMQTVQTIGAQLRANGSVETMITPLED